MIIPTENTDILKLENFKNPQTGNTAQMLVNNFRICFYYQEECATGMVSAGRDHQESYWASWIPADETSKAAHVTEEVFLDCALDELENILGAEATPIPWHFEATGH